MRMLIRASVVSAVSDVVRSVEGNAPAVGKPVINGTFKFGQTLTVDTSGITVMRMAFLVLLGISGFVLMVVLKRTFLVLRVLLILLFLMMRVSV